MTSSTTNNSSSLSFRLVPDQVAKDGEALALTPGLNFFELSTLQLQPQKPENLDGFLVLEPVGRDLLMLTPGENEAPIRVNDLVAPSVALLRQGDHLHVGDCPFEVAQYSQPDIAPPDEAALGKACPVCRTPFEPYTRVYRCACGCLIHHEEGENPEELLICSDLLDGCPACGREITLTEGYVRTPFAES